jgi:hypothetical protein
MRVTFKMRTTDGFFNAPMMEKAVNKARMKMLRDAGAFVQRRARSSMRRLTGKKNWGKTSASGKPPYAHSPAKLSLKTIWFKYDATRDSMIVGPIKFNQVEDTIKARTTVPALHEFGQTAIILEKRWVPNVGQPSPWRRRNRRRSVRRYYNGREETRRRAAQYQKRPFMGPALEAEAPNFPDLFENAIKKT